MSEMIAVGTIQPELVRQAEHVHALAASYQITCPELREAASGDLKEIKRLQKEVSTQRTSITKPINEALRRINEMFRAPALWLDEAEIVLKRACLTWDQEQERKRREAAAEAARVADAERQRLEAAAKREAAAGNTETAHAIQQAAAMTAPVPVLSEAPKIAGESHREIWRCEVFDLKALCLAVAEGRVPETYVEPNMIALNGSARILKDALAVPGVRPTCEKILASRSA